MSCSPFDLRDYFFGELAATERSATETHLAACLVCREELEKLHATRSALLCVPDQEPPRRIAFVSDKVFEPRWWQKIWSSGPQLGFASAALVAGALVYHAAAMPKPAIGAAPLAVSTTSAPDEARVRSMIEAEVDRRVNAEVGRVLSETEQMIDVRLRQSKEKHNQDLVLVREFLEKWEKRNSYAIRTAAYE